jgi:hypothetical protein
MNYSGNWHITEMSEWDSDYLNEEVQAFIKIDEKGNGEFQFGLVSGQIDGEITNNRLEFTWEGSDEYNEVSGAGWLALKDENHLEGKIKFHHGDNSTLIAERIHNHYYRKISSVGCAGTGEPPFASTEI